MPTPSTRVQRLPIPQTDCRIIRNSPSLADTELRVESLFQVMTKSDCF